MEPMKLWEVTNGWTGESYMRVVVVAQDEAAALRMAGDVFLAKDPKYADQRLAATLCCADLTRPWVSAPSDSGIEP